MSEEDQSRIREFVAHQEKKEEEKKQEEAQSLIRIKEHAKTIFWSMIMPLVLKTFETGDASFFEQKIDFVDYKKHDYATFVTYLCSIANEAKIRTVEQRDFFSTIATIRFSWYPKEMTNQEEAMKTFVNRFEFAQTSDSTFSVPLGDLEESLALAFVQSRGYKQAHVGFSHGVDQEKMVFISTD